MVHPTALTTVEHMQIDDTEDDVGIMDIEIHNEDVADDVNLMDTDNDYEQKMNPIVISLMTLKCIAMKMTPHFIDSFCSNHS